MHYLIWIPSTHINPEDNKLKTLERVGLADHVDNAEPMPLAGPAGAGVLFCWRKNSPCDFNYDPSKQDWYPAAAQGEWAHGRYWVGLSKTAPPTPDNLARPYQYKGVATELGDGKSWLIPRALELPHSSILMDDGSVRFEVQRRFHAFYVRACEIAKHIYGGDGVPHSDVFHFCVDALRLNYRITPEVASRLDLIIRDGNMQQIVDIVVGARDG